MPPTPHDALFRATFSQPRHAAAELRAVLPAALLARLDLSALTAVEASFIDEELRGSCADLLFRVPLRTGGAAFVYCLIEHQSTPDQQMPLRLLAYMTRIWERHAREHLGDATLPPIVPLLIHQGPRPWPWPTRFRHALVESPELRGPLGVRLLDFDFIVDDLACISDELLLARGMDAIARLTLLALRHARAKPRLADHVAAAMATLRDDLRGPSTVPALAQLVRYVLEVGEGPPANVRATLAAALHPDQRSSVMSTADLLRAEGRVEARRETLQEILEIRFGAIDQSLRERIATASIEQLVVWIRRSAVANSVASVFTD